MHLQVRKSLNISYTWDGLLITNVLRYRYIWCNGELVLNLSDLSFLCLSPHVVTAPPDSDVTTHWSIQPVLRYRAYWCIIRRSSIDVLNVFLLLTILPYWDTVTTENDVPTECVEAIRYLLRIMDFFIKVNNSMVWQWSGNIFGSLVFCFLFFLDLTKVFFKMSRKVFVPRIRVCDVFHQ